MRTLAQAAEATVGFVKPQGQLPHLRTYADGAWNNNQELSLQEDWVGAAVGLSDDAPKGRIEAAEAEFDEYLRGHTAIVPMRMSDDELLAGASRR